MQQHPFQISRKIEYGMRAMIFLASQPMERTVPFREIARRMDVPEGARQGSLHRGAHGGYALARPARQVSFLDVIEAVEGPVVVSDLRVPEPVVEPS
jgi:DNA-binding IscR family transcriptional regulator